MSKYKEIKGFKVQTLATDTAASAVAGGAWASGGALTTGRNGLRGAGVSQTAVVVFGGNDGSTTGKTENYNGSSWSETTDLNTAKSNGLGVGTYTSALCTETGTNEKWNGSSWTELAELNTPRAEIGSFGTSTAALAIGNQNGSSGIVEQWNGSSWTEVGDLTTAMGSVCGFGTTSAGNAAGGYTGTVSATNNQIWDGSSWSEGSDLNQSRYFGGASGTSTLGLVFGGYKTQSPASQIANTESWDGTSFTEQADLSTARYVGAPAHNSTSSDALYAGGNPGNQSATEEWTAPSVFTKINLGQVYYNSGSNAFKVTQQLAPTGSWSSGGNLNTAREILAGWGTDNTAAGVAGGSPSTAATELYNGTAWTEVNALNQARASVAGAGLYSAGIAVGAQPNTYYDKVELWDGTNWTETTEINTGRGYASLSGVQTACILIGGYSSPPTQRYAICEQWDGSSWTEIADLNTGRPGTGTAAGAPVTDTIAFGGYLSSTSPTKQNLVEKWNGTSWTEVAEMNTKRNVTSGHGDSGSNAGAFGGEQDSSTTNAEIWNGSSWTELANNANAGWRQLGGVPSLTKGILSGGSPPNNAYTEEWNALEENKTITVS